MNGTDEWFCYTVATRTGPEDVYSGATNNVARRIRQHNGTLKGGSFYCKRWGNNNARLVVLIGPLPRKTALSIERYLKRCLFVGRGIRGRCKAVMKLLELPAYTAKSIKLSRDQLRKIRVRTALTENEFLGNGVELHHHIEFAVEFGTTTN